MHGGIAVELKCKAKVMDAAAIDRTLVRIAHEILEKNDGTEVFNRAVALKDSFKKA